MNRGAAIAIVVAHGVLTVSAFLAPWWWALGLTLVALGTMRHGRRGYVTLALLALATNALLLGVVLRDPLLGVKAGLRLVAALGVNLALFSWLPAARLLDGLRLPARAATLVAAVLLAAEDVARDFARLKEARRMEGEWPKGRLASARAAAALLPPLVVVAERRAHARRDALRLAGHDAPASFVPIVAVAALAAGGRMALLAVPNVSLTFVLVFLAGILYGARVAALGAMVAMAITNFLISGLDPMAFVNVPAMALLGIAGGLLRGADLDGRSRLDRASGRVIAFALGAAATLLFSVATDTMSWLVATWAAPGAWLPIVLAGLAFNLLPAVANGMLFALSVQPVLRARRALDDAIAPSSAGPQPHPAPAETVI